MPLHWRAPPALLKFQSSHLHPRREPTAVLCFRQLQETLPSVKAIERRSMNVWEDDPARNAVVATNRRRLIIAGFFTEACGSFPALSALKDSSRSYRPVGSVSGSGIFKRVRPNR
jgi:hypothetical protein